MKQRLRTFLHRLRFAWRWSRMNIYTWEETVNAKPRRDYHWHWGSITLHAPDKSVPEYTITMMVRASDPRGKDTVIAYIYRHQGGELIMAIPPYAALTAPAIQYCLSLMNKYEDHMDELEEAAYQAHIGDNPQDDSH